MPPSREARIADARARFVNRAQGDALHLGALITASEDPCDATVQEIRDIAHRLVGTAGTFGFASTSAAAAQLVATIEGCPSRDDLSGAVKALSQSIVQMEGNG